jgi:hypothetical protein
MYHNFLQAIKVDGVGIGIGCFSGLCSPAVLNVCRSDVPVAKSSCPVKYPVGVPEIKIPGLTGHESEDYIVESIV